VLVEGETGYTFKDKGSFIEAVIKYYNNTPEYKEYMQKKALEKASEFSLESFGERVLQVYYQAIHRKKIQKSKKITYNEKKLEHLEQLKDTDGENEVKIDRLRRKIILKKAKKESKSQKRRLKIADKSKSPKSD
jgi:uncharacterized protein YaeQ